MEFLLANSAVAGRRGLSPTLAVVPGTYLPHPPASSFQGEDSVREVGTGVKYVP